ncbi:MAG: AAA domain-containing protein [Bacteroidota bacterium]
MLTTTQKLQHDKAEYEATLQSLESEKIELEEQRYSCAEQLNHWQLSRPGRGNFLWPNKEYRQWEEGYKKARNADKAAQKEWKAHEKQIRDVRSRLEQLVTKQTQLQQKTGNQEKYLMYYKERMGSNFPDSAFWQQPTEVLQQSTPWHSERLHELRGELFVRAMNLHRAFIGRTARQFHNNLSSIKALVGDGKSWPNNRAGERAQDVLPALWTSLFTVVPVVSTTLASIGNLKGLGKEGISWVLIDEAGQAAPQAAVGVLQRARRAIVVGDPNQTPPTVTLPPKMSQVFREHHQLDVQWDIHETSAQSLADEANIFGTYINQGGTTSWVGAPLRVHRRCQNPMFKVANQIAYDGLMVQATSPEISPLAQALRTEELPEGNCWFNVQGRLSGTKHWIAEEGKKTLEILQRLCTIEQQLPNVYIITPFKNIAESMKRLLRDYAKDWPGQHIDTKKVYAWISESVGTIHTFQGKEADGIILVLGASDNVDARNWVAGSPNILNVALTRAKDFCLVVGDYKVWSQHDYFKTLADELTPIPKERI